MPVWGVWLDDSFFFSTGRRSLKARNLAFSSSCVVCPEGAAEAVVLEGRAQMFSQPSLIRRFAAAYKKKYDWDMGETKDPI